MYQGSCLCGSSKANWDTFDAEIPCYDGFEPSRGK